MKTLVYQLWIECYILKSQSQWKIKTRINKSILFAELGYNLIKVYYYIEKFRMPQNKNINKKKPNTKNTKIGSKANFEQNLEQ